MSSQSYEDYTRRTIDALGKVLARLLRLKEQGHKKEEIKVQLNEVLKEYVGIDLPAIIQMNDNEFLNILNTVLKDKPQQAELLADIIKVYAETVEHSDGESKQAVYNKLKILYEYSLKADKSFSLVRQQKLNEVLKVLSS